MCDSFSNDGQKESLMWISPEDNVKYFPAFFRTELTNPAPYVKHIVTDERV